MEQPTQFTPSRILAFQQIPETLRLMDEILDGDVASEFEKVLGSTRCKGTRPTQLLQHNRYSLFWDGGWFEVVLGFSRPLDQEAEPADFLRLSTSISAGSGGTRRHFSAANKAFKFSGIPGWRYNTDGRWAWMAREDSIQTVLGASDHVEACRRWMKARIDEIRGFKERTGHLPWTSSPVASSN